MQRDSLQRHVRRASCGRSNSHSHPCFSRSTREHRGAGFHDHKEQCLRGARLLGSAIARLWRVHSLRVQSEHRAQQLFLGKAIAHQIKPRVAKGAVCFQERIVRLGIDHQFRLVHRSSFPQTEGT